MYTLMNASSEYRPWLSGEPDTAQHLAELVQQAIAYGLLSRCRITPNLVYLYKQYTVVLEATPERALVYLQGLLHGYRQALRMTETIPEQLLMDALNRFAA